MPSKTHMRRMRAARRRLLNERTRATVDKFEERTRAELGLAAGVGPADRAAARGHKLKDDPPALAMDTLSSMSRMTCSECGRAVLWGPEARKGYGSALEEDCKAS